MLKKIMAISLGFSALSIATAHATTPGAYIEGQLGYAHTGTRFIKPFPSGKVDSKYQGGLAGRVAIGYQFNPNLAAEMGYLQLADQEAKLKSPVNQSITINQHAFDLVGKGILPLSDKFNLYAKAGVAYLVTDLSGDTINQHSIIKPVAKQSWAPEAGIGLTYNVTPNMFIDTAFTHIQPIGKNKPSNINMATIGLGFTFG
ncbi:outer membrane beta-barrel protein [Rickettsiella grylli]|uniref:Outer membrane protein OmpA n=1 Tax=Rickettsiella grylli TaxID=59196 RepID=A8PML9_9COXI|nr:outer membrane beta-barrel protein [Rickettsiella grylli]EDP45932.1 putative outer membrane protein OmpA [Rickettsiella grylli]